MITINVLVTSISKKVPLLQAVQKAILKVDSSISLIGADLNQNCIGRYFVDDFWEMPSLDYITVDEMINFCKKKNIRYIIPTRDGELLYFSNHRKTFEKSGISVMISDPEVIETCLDKYMFNRVLLAQDFPTIPTVLSIDELKCSYFVVKERYGAGAKSIRVHLTKEEAYAHAKKLEAPVFQPYIQGIEMSVDLYITRTGEVKGVIARKRDYVVNGESQVTSTIKNEKLERMCMDVAKYLKLYGHVVMQVIIDNDGNFHIIECNSRFGGASTLSVEAGLDSFYWFFLESNGENLEKLPFIRSSIEKRQVRYPTDLVLDIKRG